MRLLAPILLFTYNRPLHTKQTLDALAANDLAAQSELYIYIDGVKANAQEKDIQKTTEVRKIANAETRFKKVTIKASPQNKGLANSIIEGVTENFRLHEMVIVLEDDMITSNYFLTFLNEALDLYKNNYSVACVSGYIYPVKDRLPETFFIKGADCWGWGTWRRAWQLFEPDGNLLRAELLREKSLYDFNFYDSYPYLEMLEEQIAGKNSSWAIRWYASAFLRQKLTLYPAISFVQNIGFDGSGTHSGKRNLWNGKELNAIFQLIEIPAVENTNAKTIIADYFRIITKKSLGHHVKRFIRAILHKFSS